MGCSGSLTPAEDGGLDAVWPPRALLLLGDFLGILVCPLYSPCLGRTMHLNCVWSTTDRYLEGLPHLCPVFLLEPINRSLPAADHRLATGLETRDSPCPLMLPASCSFIANAIATAMAAMLSFVGSTPSITLIISCSPLAFSPGNSRVISMIANIMMTSAVMTTAIPTAINSAPSPSCSLILPTTLFVRRGRCK